MRAILGTPSLLRLVLRRDRLWLSLWVLGLVGVTYGTANAVAATYDTPEEIASYAANLGGSAATIAMSGPPVALDTIGGILVFETSVTLLVGVALMSIFTVVRHTRAEEEVGRTELLAATVVGRHAPLAAAVLVACAASSLVGLGTAGSMLAQDMPGRAAWSYAGAVTALGWVFAGVAAVAAQLSANARTARGVALAALGVAFVVRAVGDVRDSALSWFSPIGWSQQVRVSDDNRWWPLLASLALIVALLWAAARLVIRRDVGSGILPARPGPASAAAGLRSPFGLAWRLQRGSIVGWAAGIGLLGVVFGSLTREIERMAADNPTLAEYFQATGGEATDAFFATALLMMAIGASGFAVSSGLRAHGEESAGRLEQVLAGAVPRTELMLHWLLVTLMGSVVLVAAGGLGMAVADAVVRGDASEVPRLVAVSLGYLPGVLVLASLGALLTGWLPRGAAFAWLGVAVAFVVGWLGPVLDLPDVINALSPFDHLPTMPVESVAAAPLGALTALAAVITALGVVGFRRRDLT